MRSRRNENAGTYGGRRNIGEGGLVLVYLPKNTKNKKHKAKSVL